MNDLRVTLVQAATRWHDASANYALYGGLVRPLRGLTDLVVLPETFTSGFTNDTVHQAESMDGPTLAFMSALAAEVRAVVTGSVVIRVGTQVFNRLIWMRPDGSFAHYDKRHLFRMAGEHERYCAGQQRLVVELSGWRVCPLVCYDLRFPVWSRNRYAVGGAGGCDYDLLLFVANWPSARRQPWRTLLRARAIENLAYVAAVNRTGSDGNQLHYAGDSAVLDPLGETVLELGAEAQVATVKLSAQMLADHRRRFPAWMDADDFVIGDPG